MMRPKPRATPSDGESVSRSERDWVSLLLTENDEADVFEGLHIRRIEGLVGVSW